MPPVFGFTRVPVDSTGNKIREAIVDTDKHVQCSAQADPEDAAAVAKVTNAAPASDAYGGVVRVPEPGAAATSNVGQSVAAVTILAANSARRGFVIENDSEDLLADLFVKFGAGASSSSYTRRVKPGEAWDRRGGYTGAITGAWSATGSGSARVTEES